MFLGLLTKYIRYKTEDAWKRIDLLTFKDIDNIKRSYNIEIRDGKIHNNDAISVDLWIRECQDIYEVFFESIRQRKCCCQDVYV